MQGVYHGCRRTSISNQAFGSERLRLRAARGDTGIEAAARGGGVGFGFESGSRGIMKKGSKWLVIREEWLSMS